MVYLGDMQGMDRERNYFFSAPVAQLRESNMYYNQIYSLFTNLCFCLHGVQGTRVYRYLSIVNFVDITLYNTFKYHSLYDLRLMDTSTLEGKIGKQQTVINCSATRVMDCGYEWGWRLEQTTA